MDRLKLLIVIPALNEEESIASIIERTLAARARILSETPVTEVELTVVSDGSTDRTAERAGAYRNQVQLIVFERNRGYGAAIKEAWRQSDAELLAFLDADGTCDPAFFVELCQLIERERADVVLGCRLTRASRMPLVRRLGNVLFALLLSFFSSRRVRDTASGMRVVRRSSLPRLSPLPDGMHFTPAMSARAILSPELKILEQEMPYEERAGESKLRVVRDGLRFLRVIVEAALLYRPSRPLGFLGALFVLTAFLLILPPALYYLGHRYVLEWMIYRFVVADLLTTSGTLLLAASYLSRRVVQMVLQLPEQDFVFHRLTGQFLRGRWLWIVTGSFVLVAALLVLPSFLQLVRTGGTYEHWSRFIAASVLVGVSLTLIVARVMDFTLDLLSARLAYLREEQVEVAPPRRNVA
ncbi:MAG TPA: glycosyltransferase family 2 protein [Myxococcaceae bacterium]|nr:glycosyltransferase family 2 protein [Myxococcaceae bacterium]